MSAGNKSPIIASEQIYLVYAEPGFGKVFGKLRAQLGYLRNEIQHICSGELSIHDIYFATRDTLLSEY